MVHLEALSFIRVLFANFMVGNIKNLDKFLKEYVDKRRLFLKLKEKIPNHNFVVFDVGANVGDFTRQMRRSFPTAEYFLFEANDCHSDTLSRLGCPYFIEVLSDKVCEVTFYRRNGTGDSYYKELDDSIYNQDTGVALKTTTLELVIKREKISPPYFLKIDTQGSELDIISGLGELNLKNVRFIYLEVPLLEYNRGAPTFSDYINFLLQIGFQPIDLCETHLHEGRLVQVDLLFERLS